MSFCKFIALNKNKIHIMTERDFKTTYSWLEPQLDPAEKDEIFDCFQEVEELGKAIFWARYRLEMKIKTAQDKRWSNAGCLIRCSKPGCNALIDYKAYDSNKLLCEKHFSDTSTYSQASADLALPPNL